MQVKYRYLDQYWIRTSWIKSNGKWVAILSTTLHWDFVYDKMYCEHFTCMVRPSFLIRSLPSLVHGAGSSSSRFRRYRQTKKPDFPLSGQYFTTLSQWYRLKLEIDTQSNKHETLVIQIRSICLQFGWGYQFMRRINFLRIFEVEFFRLKFNTFIVTYFILAAHKLFGRVKVSANIQTTLSLVPFSLKHNN